MARDRGMSADFPTRDAIVDRAASRGMSPTIANHRNGGALPSGDAGAWPSRTIANHRNGDAPPCGEAGAWPSRTIANHSNGEVPPSDETGERDPRTMENHSNGRPLSSDGRAIAYAPGSTRGASPLAALDAGSAVRLEGRATCAVSVATITSAIESVRERHFRSSRRTPMLAP